MYTYQLDPSEEECGGDKVSKYRSCPICGMKCHRSSIKRHIQTHSDARPFYCSVCDKSFKRKDYWKRHMTWHKSENSIS